MELLRVLTVNFASKHGITVSQTKQVLSEAADNTDVI